MRRAKEQQTILDTIREHIDIIDDLNIRRYRSDTINESIKVLLAELKKLSEL